MDETDLAVLFCTLAGAIFEAIVPDMFCKKDSEDGQDYYESFGISFIRAVGKEALECVGWHGSNPVYVICQYN